MQSPERSDILIALAMAFQMKVSEASPVFGPSQEVQQARPSSHNSAQGPRLNSLDPVSALCAEAGPPLEEQATRLRALDRDARVRWTLSILAQSRTALN